MPNNEWGDFQTPENLAAKVMALLGSEWGRILEPTCGIGRFLTAAETVAGEVERVGIEVQPGYAAEAEAPGRTVVCRNVFELHLGRDIQWRRSGPLLVVGNPPWVTNSQLGSLGSINLPPKTNLRNLRGFEAMTGASNFDIAEYILMKLMVELQDQAPTIALLVKTQVARNVLSYAEQFALPYSDFEIRGIDAKGWFGASVDACLFILRHSNEPHYVCNVYSDLDSGEPTHTIGVTGGRMVSNLEAYLQSSFADGSSPLVWRSGVKHDAARVMEIDESQRASLQLEDEYVFPLLKCTDIFRGRLKPSRFMVIPQRRLGEDTSHLMRNAPRLWAYLDAHGDILDARASRIYKGQPRFAVFGLGDYTFAPYKIAVSGLHKQARFVFLAPYEGKPIVVDDATYLASFEDGQEAALCLALLTHHATSALIESLVFWDSKRPINKKLLQRLDLGAIARKSSLADLEDCALDAAIDAGVVPLEDWETVLVRLMERWDISTATPSPRKRRSQNATPPSSASVSREVEGHQGQLF